MIDDAGVRKKIRCFKCDDSHKFPETSFTSLILLFKKAAVLFLPSGGHLGSQGCSFILTSTPFLDAIASPSSYPCQWVGHQVNTHRWNSKFFHFVYSLLCRVHTVEDTVCRLANTLHTVLKHTALKILLANLYLFSVWNMLRAVCTAAGKGMIICIASTLWDQKHHILVKLTKSRKSSQCPVSGVNQLSL